MDISSFGIGPEMLQGGNPLEMLKGGNPLEMLKGGGMDKLLGGFADSDMFQSIFNRIDTDQDGKISQEEIQTGVKTGMELLQGLFQGSGKMRAYEAQASSVMNCKDTDKNGSIDFKEAGLAADAFAQIDTDGNGGLTIDELQNAVFASKQQQNQAYFGLGGKYEGSPIDALLEDAAKEEIQAA